MWPQQAVCYRRRNAIWGLDWRREKIGKGKQLTYLLPWLEWPGRSQGVCPPFLIYSELRVSVFSLLTHSKKRNCQLKCSGNSCSCNQPYTHSLISIIVTVLLCSSRFFCPLFHTKAIPSTNEITLQYLLVRKLFRMLPTMERGK